MAIAAGKRRRQQPVHRRHRRKVFGLVADHLTVIGDRGLKRRLRGEVLGLRLRECGLRLRDVGARHFADVEAVPRLPKLLLQHLDVAAVEIQRRGVAHHVHVIRERR